MVLLIIIITCQSSITNHQLSPWVLNLKQNVDSNFHKMLLCFQSKIQVQQEKSNWLLLFVANFSGKLSFFCLFNLLHHQYCHDHDHHHHPDHDSGHYHPDNAHHVLNSLVHVGIVWRSPAQFRRQNKCHWHSCWRW